MLAFHRGNTAFLFGSAVCALVAPLWLTACAMPVAEEGGRIIAGGIAPLPSFEYGFGLVAVSANGTIDASFGGPQGLFTRITASSAVTALLLQPDGKIIALGSCVNGIALARYIGP